jgi:hypothetical protein
MSTLRGIQRFARLDMFDCGRIDALAQPSILGLRLWQASFTLSLTRGATAARLVYLPDGQQQEYKDRDIEEQVSHDDRPDAVRQNEKCHKEIGNSFRDTVAPRIQRIVRRREQKPATAAEVGLMPM